MFHTRKRHILLLLAIVVGIAHATCPPIGADPPVEVPPISETEPVSPPVSPPVSSPVSPPAPIDLDKDFLDREPTDDEWRDIYRYRYQTGVNFGGPFLLERWMNFALFEGIADWIGTSQDAFNRGVGNVTELKIRLERMWKDYIPECDYALAASWGVNTIRLPVGYYIIGDKYPDVPMLDPFKPFSSAYVNAEDAVHEVFRIAEKYKMGVLLDLHAAPGSQNGADHSGVAGPTALYDNETYRKTTVATLRRFAEIYGKHKNLVGIELLNEPRDHHQLQNIYKDAYAQIRQVDKHIPVYVCDTIWTSNWDKWANFILDNKWENAVLDVHKYYAYDGGASPIDAKINGIRTWERDVYRNLNNRLPVVVGEWSNAVNPGSYHGYDQQRRDGSRRNFGVQQLETHKLGAGFHFWSWKGDWPDGNDWDFKSLQVQGWMPANYFPFTGITECPALKREVAEKLMARADTERAAGLASHRAYWERTEPNRQGGFNWPTYEAGFSAGYAAAVKFFYYAESRVGMYQEYPAHKARLYAASLESQGKPTTHAWQYKDGFNEGIQRFSEAIKNFLPYK